MQFGPIQASVTAVIAFLLAVIVWLAHRVKQKNRQLRQVLAELQARKKESISQCSREPMTIAKAKPDPLIEMPQPETTVTNTSPDTIDAFLWQHLGDAFLWKRLAESEPPAQTEIRLPSRTSIPAGMCTSSELERLLENDPPFSGLVVLIGFEEGHSGRSCSSIETFIRGLLGPSDCGCRRSGDEFILICPGLHGAAAQRRLNEISESLWSFQLRGGGAFSLLFSWGGIGVENEPLSDAIASATNRMLQTKRSRLTFFSRKAG